MDEGTKNNETGIVLTCTSLIQLFLLSVVDAKRILTDCVQN